MSIFVGRGERRDVNVSGNVGSSGADSDKSEKSGQSGRTNEGIIAGRNVRVNVTRRSS